MRRTDLFILSGVDLEYTRKNIFTFYGECFCIRVYILKITEIKYKMKNKSSKLQSARLSDKTNFWNFSIACIQFIIHVYLFFRCKTL